MRVGGLQRRARKCWLLLWMAIIWTRATLCKEPDARARKFFVSIGSDDWLCFCRASRHAIQLAHALVRLAAMRSADPVLACSQGHPALTGYLLISVLVISLLRALCLPLPNAQLHQGAVVQQFAGVPWAGCPVTCGEGNGVAERRSAYAHDGGDRS